MQVPGRGFRVTLFLVIAGITVYSFSRGNAFALIGVAAVALIAPEIVALFEWLWGKGREHVYDPGENDRLYTYDLVNIHMRMQGRIPWFVAREIGWALEIRDIAPHVARFDVTERDEIGEDGAVCLSEKGVLRLIAASRNRDARRFRLWFEREVMFAIRRANA